MSSSDSELNVRPDAVRVVKEGLNSEYIIILTSNYEIMELTVTKHVHGLFSKVEHCNINVYVLTLTSYTVSMVHLRSHLMFPIKYAFLYKTRR
jgi:hypothetical protein